MGEACDRLGGKMMTIPDGRSYCVPQWLAPTGNSVATIQRVSAEFTAPPPRGPSVNWTWALVGIAILAAAAVDVYFMER